MKLDLVHDLQNVYRKLLNSMSRPGRIENIADIGEKVKMQIDLDRNLTALLMTLLDGEVSFCFVAQNSKTAESKINQLTYAQKECPEQADYLIISSGAQATDIQTAFSKAKIGSLSNPHDSATLIIQVDQLGSGTQLVLSGPGIQTSQDLAVQYAYDWLAMRNERTMEFPLGIDLILIDHQGNIACLPRTTRITEQGAI